MTPHERFIAAAKLLGGDTDRWQAAAGAKLRISRGHMHHLVTGVRTLTAEMIVRTVEATRADALIHRELADRLDAAFDDMPMAELAALPTMTKAEYERQADEAVGIIEAMVGNAVDEGEKST